MYLYRLNYPLMLMALVLTVGEAPLLAQVNGAPLKCMTLSSIPAYLRAEGYTELVGDILLNCTGGAPTAVGRYIPQANITIFLNTSITSRILSNTGSEALLLIDEPGSSANPLQQLCGSLSGCPVPGTGGVGEPFSGADVTRPNIFQGIVSGNSVTFFGIPIDPPGTGSRSYRITNIRANATAVPPAYLPQVTATISTSPPAAVPIDNSQVPVGFVSSGLSFGSGIFAIPACTGINDSNRFTVVAFSENFANSFKPRTALGPTVTTPQNIPGVFAFNTESGFGFAGLPGAGLADSGTRFRTIWRNIPPGVNLWVSTSSFGASPTSMAVLIPSETGAYSPVASTTTLLGVDVVQLPVVNGTATAVWEVTASDPSVIESFSFGVIITSSTSVPPVTGTSQMTVNGSFAPAPPMFSVADAVKAQAVPFPVPRFADTSTPANMLTVTPCVTNLLFPFITTQAGFDSGLAISSTSKDPFGTAPESGPCTLSFFGSNAPPQITTQPIAAGSTYTAVISSMAPDFQGYITAECNFQFAHGFAFISDFGARNLAMSYLALVVPTQRVLQDMSSEILFH